MGASGAQQLAGGALNIAHSGYPDFARASLQGASVKIIINDIVASPYAVFAKPAIKKIADKHKLYVIEDNAQGIGARGDGFKVAELSDATTTSFRA